MSYKVIYSKNAFKDIKKLDPIIKKKIGKKILEYSPSPIKHAKKLISPKIGSYRWRAGNYRVVFDIKGKTIKVLKVGHRKDIYRQ